MVAEGPPAKNQGRQDNEDEQDQIIGDQGLNIADGEAVGCFVEKVHPAVAAGHHGQDRYGANPGNPEKPFDDVAPQYLFIPGGKKGLLAARSRTDPAAPCPAGDRGGQKQQGEHDETAVDDALCCRYDDKSGREIIEGGGKEEECKKNQSVA